MNFADEQFRVLHQQFAGSEYGQRLAGQTRFNDFKPDWVETDLWCDLLGDDVNNLRHMPHTGRLVARFGIHNQLSLGSRHVLGITAITHDWGEAIIGDIALPTKCKDDEIAEEIGYRQIACELLGDAGGNALTDKVWSVLKHEDAKHGNMFRAVEYIGYCTTAMRAGRTAVALTHGFLNLEASRRETKELIGGLMTLESEVTVHNYPVLTEFVKQYPGIEKQLAEYRVVT